MSKSLCELIATSRTPEGVLPRHFCLPREESSKGPAFADGALDGITMYHTAPAFLNSPDKKELGRLITLAADGSYSEAEEGFAAFCEEHRALVIIDDLQKYIVNHERKLDPDALFEFAVNMLLESGDRECVKVALSILELFDVYDNDALADTIRIVGLSDEFTLFSAYLMRSWPQAEEELLELAKRVRGWGRVHCVDLMTAENEETRKWLFFNGVDNDVMPAYSAWAVYDKARVEEIIEREDLSYEEIHAILMLTEGLMDEGPVSGLSRMNKPREYLKKVLEKFESYKGDEGFSWEEEDELVIKAIRERLE